MNTGRTVFAQLMEFIPTYQFQLCVDRYQGNRYVKDFSCWDQFLCLAFAQLTFRATRHDIEACLRSQQPKLYHMGFRGRVSRNTLAHANEHRNWRIYADFAQILIAIARDLYRDEPFGVELSETVYALDSTTIDLCLSLFPWGKFRRRKSAVKLHNTTGSAGQHSDQCLCDWGPSPRRQHSGRAASRGRSVLLAGSWLCGLCPSLCPHSSVRFLHHSRQKEYAIL